MTDTTDKLTRDETGWCASVVSTVDSVRCGCKLMTTTTVRYGDRSVDRCDDATKRATGTACQLDSLFGFDRTASRTKSGAFRCQSVTVSDSRTVDGWMTTVCARQCRQAGQRTAGGTICVGYGTVCCVRQDKTVSFRYVGPGVDDSRLVGVDRQHDGRFGRRLESMTVRRMDDEVVGQLRRQSVVRLRQVR